VFSAEEHWLFLSKGKAPIHKWGTEHLNHKGLFAHFGASNDNLLCMATGERSQRIVVLDLDYKGPIPREMKQWLTKLSLPVTLVVPTPRGGKHLYFRVPDDMNIPRNTTSQLHLNVDFRGEGGMVVLYPGINGQLAHYDCGLIADLPASLYAACLAASKHKKVSTSAAANSVHSMIPDGKRDDTLTSLAGIRRANGDSEREIYNYLSRENDARCTPPLGDKDIRKIAASAGGWAKGERPPIVPTSVLIGETLTELALRKTPKILPVCGPLSGASLTTLHGSSGSGKSLYALHMAWAMSEGVTFGTDWQCPKPLKVLYVDRENPTHYVKERASVMASRTDNLRIATRSWMHDNNTRIDLALEEHRKRLVDEPFDYLFLDSIVALNTPTKDSPMTSAEWFDRLMPMFDDITGSGRGVMLLGNLNKQGGMYGTEAQVWRSDRNWIAKIYSQKQEMQAHPQATAKFTLKGTKERGIGQVKVDSSWEFIMGRSWLQLP